MEYSPGGCAVSGDRGRGTLRRAPGGGTLVRATGLRWSRARSRSGSSERKSGDMEAHARTHITHMRRQVGSTASTRHTAMVYYKHDQSRAQ